MIQVLPEDLIYGIIYGPNLLITSHDMVCPIAHLTKSAQFPNQANLKAKKSFQERVLGDAIQGDIPSLKSAKSLKWRAQHKLAFQII